MKIYKKDWEYNSSEDINALKELMTENIKHQDDGEVGIFWYDAENDDLFGVKSADVNDVPFYKSNLFNGKEVKTCGLHSSVWEKEYYRGRDQRFQSDYALVPRGRVSFIKDEGFVVIVGNWVDKYPQAKPLILFEFNLPKDTEFCINEDCE